MRQSTSRTIKKSKYVNEFSKGWLSLFYNIGLIDWYDHDNLDEEILDNILAKLREEADIKRYCLGLLD